MDKKEIAHLKQMLPSLPDLSNQNHAQAFHDRLVHYIVEFEKGLKEDEEVGARLVSFGESLEIHIDNLGYWNPSLICFYGRDANGRELQLVQHVSQISLLFMKVPRTNTEPERIGFKLQQQRQQESAQLDDLPL